MKIIRKVGATSQILQVFIQDSSSTTGAGLTGLVFNTSSLTAYFHRDTDTTATAISLVTMTVGTFTSSGFKEIDATNMPGWYQLCPPNAALASGASSVGIHLKGAANMAPLPIEIDLDAQVDVTFWNGTVVATPATAGIPDINVKNINNVAAATPGASGGVLISGSNAGTTTLAALTVTGSMTVSDGLLVSRSSSNTSAITATGNGTGSGAVFTSGSGATGDGMQTTAASTNGNGMASTGTGTGAGRKTTGGGTGNGLQIIGGSTSGDALLTSATSGHGVTFAGAGTTKHGINATGGATTSHGISATGGGVGHGILATSGSGATGNGITATAASTNGSGMTLTKTGTGSDLNATVTPLTLAKTTNITGFNDIAATAIVSSGAITTSGGAVSTVTTVTNQLTAAAIATGIWQDATAGDFTTANSVGKSLYNAFTSNTSVFTTASLVNAPTGGSAPTVAQIATAVWQDATAGDFTTTASIGKSLYTAGVVPGGSGGLFIAGSNAGTTVNFTGNLSGSVGSVTGAVGSVTGAVGSVTGNVGGNVTGTVGSVVGAVGSVTGNVGGNVTGSVASVVGNVGGNVTGSVGSVTAAVTINGASPLTESYAAKGAALTVSQALYELVQQRSEMSIASTTMTVLKRDQVTTAKTYTLNSATTPSSITEAS